MKPSYFGYTLADLDDLARRVVRNNRAWWPAGDRADQHATAWEGIAGHLCAAPAPPSATELLEAGRRALGAEVKAQMRHHGTRTDGTNNGAGFARYWSWHAMPAASPEGRITDHLALAQIWPALTVRQRDAITALAVHGDYHAAAAACGIEPQTFRSLLGRGRREFLARWHEGESPSRPWRCDRRVLRRETTDPAEIARRARDAATRRRRAERKASA